MATTMKFKTNQDNLTAKTVKLVTTIMTLTMRKLDATNMTMTITQN